MSEIQRRAQAAKRLLEDEIFSEALDEIRQEAASAFLTSGGDPEKMAAAFQKVTAVETFLAMMRKRLNARVVEEHAEKVQKRDERNG